MLENVESATVSLEEVSLFPRLGPNGDEAVLTTVDHCPLGQRNNTHSVALVYIQDLPPSLILGTPDDSK